MTDRASSGKRNRVFLLACLAIALLLAGVVSSYASSEPDGLNKVAADKGFDVNVQDHDLDGSPLAGYATSGVDNPRLSKGLSGVLGVFITLLLGAALFAIVSRRSRDSGGPGARGGPDPARRT